MKKISCLLAVFCLVLGILPPASADTEDVIVIETVTLGTEYTDIPAVEEAVNQIVFPLLNAPFLQIHRFLIAGTEPFSAIPLFRRMLMALPPLITGIAFFSSYQMRYLSKTAQDNAMRSR